MTAGAVVAVTTAGAPPAAATSIASPAAGVDWRTADTTDVANGDGTFTALVAAEPINYRTADGSWAAIDNSLVPDPDRAGSFVNRANSWHVDFGPTSVGVRIDTGEGVLVMRPRSARTVAPRASANSVTYPDVWPDTDLRYTVTGAGVAESVLLKSPRAAAFHDFSVLTQGSALGRSDLPAAGRDGTVDLTQALGLPAHLAAPAVLSRDGAVVSGSGAHLAALPASGVRVAVDAHWLAAQPASAFPVDLDPSVALSSTTAYSYKSDGYSCTNCGVQFGNAQDGGNTIWRSVAHYDYEQFFGDTISAASFSISYVQGTRNAYTAYVHHASALSYSGAAYGSALASGSLSTGKLTGSALTSAVASWVANRTSGAYFGFTGNETSGLYSYQKDTTTLSVTYTKPTVPGAPRSVSATAGNASAKVTFAAPASNGGAAITKYTVTASPGGRTATGTGSPITVSGLTNGTAYTFTVKATNSVGTGPASAPSNSVTPTGGATAPGAPTSVSATAGDTAATVSFAAPASNGGAPITKYTVTSSPGGVTATGTGSPITVSGLTNGTSYTFTVRATNSVGTGPASAPSSAVTPQGTGGGRPVPNQARGWDVDATVDSSQVSCMKSAGYSFSMLYTNISATNWQTTYAAMKSDGMYAVLQQGFGDGTMYDDPSQASTVADANISSAQSVSYPQGADFFLDVEQTDTATEQDVINWINTWAAKIKAAGYTPGVYSGQPSPLTNSDLSSGTLPDVKVYWQSESSSAPDPAQGYVAVQDLGTQALCNIGNGVDTDTAYIDMNGNHLVGT